MNLSALYQARGVVSKYIKRYELFIKVGLKFIAFLCLFRMISGAEMYTGTGVFNSFGVHLVLALVATILPSRIGVLIGMALCVYNIFQSSLIGAAIIGVMMLVLYVAVVRLFPDQVYFLALIPICIQWQLYLLVPIFAGLYIGIIAVVPVVIGILLWALIQIIPAFLSLQMGESLDALPKMISDASTYGIDQMTKNEQMVYLLIVSAGIILLVSLLKKLRLDYVRYIALGAGGLLGIICLIMGKVVADLPGNLVWIVLLAILSIAALAVLEFLNLSLNYKNAQNLDFEDEEYYYQVRLIPKISPVGKQKKELKTIAEREEELGKTRVAGLKVREKASEKKQEHAAPPKQAKTNVKPVRSKEQIRKSEQEERKLEKGSKLTKEEEVAELFDNWDDPDPRR